MTLNLTIPQTPHTDFSPRITVIGVGGGGTNAVDNMLVANLQGVEFVVANTDAQQLMHSRADRRRPGLARVYARRSCRSPGRWRTTPCSR